jgi:hypothetical protein
VRRALDNLANAAAAAIGRDRSLRVLIGAETRQAAAALAKARLDARSPRLGWAHELTRGSDPDYVLEKAGAPAPERCSVLSLSLLRIRGGGTGILGWLLRDANERFEMRAAQLDQPFVFWTASDDDHFAGALDALARMTPRGRPRQAGIITPFPHRLAYFLATDGQIAGVSGLRQ